MKRFILMNILMTLMIVSLCSLSACGDSNDNPTAESVKPFSPESLASKILSDVKFADKLQEIDAETAGFMFSVPEDTDIRLYMGSGIYADEFAIFTASSEDAAKEVYTVVATHVKDLEATFSDYIPEEVPKIKNAIVKHHQKYVILCITEDAENANDIIDSYIN